MKGSSFLKVMALVLCAALVLGSVGCKKKGSAPSGVQSSEGGQPVGPTTVDGTPHGKYVLETDPYFTDTSVDLSWPDKPGISTKNDFQEATGLVTDQKVILPYLFGEELTDEELREMENLNTRTPSELRRYYELLYKPMRCGVEVYSLSGDVIADIEFDMNYTGVRCIFPLQNGGFGVVVSFNDVEEALAGKMGYYDVIRIYNENCEFVGEYNIPKNVDIHNYHFLSLDDGGFLIYGDGYVAHLDQNWQLLKTATLKDYNYSRIFYDDGKYYEVVFGMGWSEDGMTKEFKYREMNLADLSFSEEKELSPVFPFEYNVFPDNGEIYGIDDYGICKLSIPTGSIEYLLYWFDVDISSSEIECLKVSSNGDIYYNSGHSLVKLHKEATNPYAGRRLIYVAVQSMDSRYMKLINEYNKSPDSKGRIVLYTPSTGTDETVYSRSGEADAADRLLLDMKSGTGPDVLINYSEFSQFDTGSILVDLNPYLDGADGIDRRMYFDNVFRAFEVDGQLFQMPLSIYLDTLLGNPDYISGVSDWTLDEFSDKMRSLPEDVKPILYTDASVQGALEPIGILLNLLYRDMPHYVDYSKGEVRFDSDDFRKLMQIAKEIAPGISQDTIYEMFEEIGEDAYHEPKYIVMQSGLCALTTVGCRHLFDFASAADLCHSEVSFIGWPTSSGKGVSAEATMTVGISAFTDEEGRAVSWDFIRFLLSSESQDKMAESGQSLGFSVCRKSLNISLQNAIDENNKNINERDPEPGMSPKMDQETSDQLIALMERVSTRYIVNPTIVNIIREEAPAYFDGSKSAEDVSRTIQNRAATLMAETA